MNYEQYDRYVYTKSDLDKYLEKFNQDIEQQKQEIIEFEKRAKERIALIDNWGETEEFYNIRKYIQKWKDKGDTFNKKISGSITER